jgi:hypothetical protein
LLWCLFFTAVLFGCSALSLSFYGGAGFNKMVSIFSGIRVIDVVLQKNSTGPGVSVRIFTIFQAVNPILTVTVIS